MTSTASVGRDERCGAGPKSKTTSWAKQLASAFQRVAVFAIDGTEAEAVALTGVGPAALGVSISLLERTPLRWALEAASPIVGAGRSPGGDTIANALGIDVPRTYAVVPLCANGRITALAYADAADAPIDLAGVAELFAVCHRALSVERQGKSRGVRLPSTARRTRRSPRHAGLRAAPPVELDGGAIPLPCSDDFPASAVVARRVAEPRRAGQKPAAAASDSYQAPEPDRGHALAADSSTVGTDLARSHSLAADSSSIGTGRGRSHLLAAGSSSVSTGLGRSHSVAADSSSVGTERDRSHKLAADSSPLITAPPQQGLAQDHDEAQAQEPNEPEVPAAECPPQAVYSPERELFGCGDEDSDAQAFAALVRQSMAELTQAESLSMPETYAPGMPEPEPEPRIVIRHATDRRDHDAPGAVSATGATDVRPASEPALASRPGPQVAPAELRVGSKPALAPARTNATTTARAQTAASALSRASTAAPPAPPAFVVADCAQAAASAPSRASAAPSSASFVADGAQAAASAPSHASAAPSSASLVADGAQAAASAQGRASAAAPSAPAVTEAEGPILGPPPAAVPASAVKRLISAPVTSPQPPAAAMNALTDADIPAFAQRRPGVYVTDLTAPLTWLHEGDSTLAPYELPTEAANAAPATPLQQTSPLARRRGPDLEVGVVTPAGVLTRDGLAQRGNRRVRRATAMTAAPLALATIIAISSLAPAARDPDARSFVVPRQASLTTVASELQSQQIIRSAAAFEWMARLSGQERVLRAGTYRLSPDDWAWDVLSQLAGKQVTTTQVTVPEGLTLREIAALLEQHGVTSSSEFVRAARDPALLAKFSITGENAEGFLFPETYTFAPGLSGRQVVEAMVEQFFVRMSQVPEAVRAEPGELRRRVILASIVEKEAADKAELARIAGVFQNRLERSMKLESCATVQYMLDRPKERLTLADVRQPSPYNTYLNLGLPPGPIANPGFGALRAAFNPERHDLLFFFAREDGTRRHVFNKTYADHQAAQRKLLRRS